VAEPQGNGHNNRGRVRVCRDHGGFLFLIDKSLEWVLYDALLSWR
jgi:hypothetical protein